MNHTSDSPGHQGERFVEGPPAVLIVDDSLANRATLSATLLRDGYVLIEASSGPEALALARTHVPDLMLLDIMMPGMDGYEVLRQVREDPDLSDMPVVLVTALDDRSALLEGFEAGADDFVAKPYEAIELRARVRGILRLNRFRKILEARSAKDKLVEEKEGLEARYREVIADAKLLVQMVLPDGRFEFVNDGWLDTFGYTRAEVDGLEFADLIHPDSLEHCEETFRTLMADSSTVDMQATFIAKDGRAVDVSGAIVPRVRDGQVVGTHALLQDVTQRKAMERQLMQAQKMEQVGTLTAGIAHDFGNTLTVISLNLAVVRGQVPDDASVLLALADMEEATRDGLALVRDLMGFSQSADLTPMVLDPAGLVAQLADMLRRILPSRVVVATELPERVEHVVVDESTVRRMVLNLATNARDAIENDGRVTLSVGDVSDGDDVPSGVVHGRFVRLSIQDTGSGMEPQVLTQIFDPFFTTKGPEHGTGLGLATVRGLIEQQGGFLSVASTPGAGTRFDLFLPTAAASTVAE